MDNQDVKKPFRAIWRGFFIEFKTTPDYPAKAITYVIPVIDTFVEFAKARHKEIPLEL